MVVFDDGNIVIVVVVEAWRRCFLDATAGDGDDTGPTTPAMARIGLAVAASSRIAAATVAGRFPLLGKEQSEEALGQLDLPHDDLVQFNYNIWILLSKCDTPLSTTTSLLA